MFNLADDFAASVVGPYVDAYDAARTPNPCVDCNRTIKFGRALDRALALGFDAIATGHHARVQRDRDGSFRLRRGADADKDQSYVLYMLGQPELARVLLPIGDLTKTEVRARAHELALRTAAKPESMDVCFVARRDRVRFVAERTVPRAGPVVETNGRVVGHHDGIANFTIGQRRGLGFTVGEPRYVVDLDASRATVTVGCRRDLLRDQITVRAWRFVSEPPGGQPLTVQTRAHGEPLPGRLVEERVHLDRPAPRVAPGQVVALYDGDTLLGGGLAA